MKKVSVKMLLNRKMTIPLNNIDNSNDIIS